MEESPKWNRRDFLRASLGTLAYFSIQGTPLMAFAREESVKLTILHTNDVHSRIDPFPMDGSKNAGLGGYARRAALVKEIRNQEKNVLLLDAGDIWQGTPYFNFFGGELEYKLMTHMGYDASTLGNHDFDAGLEGLLKQYPNAGFPFLIANYDFSDTPLNGKYLPNKIFEKDGLKIGVFGLGIELTGLVPDAMFGNTRYHDPIETAKAQVKYLKKDRKCDVVICLSHLGYSYQEKKVCDKILAASTQDIDLIIGGHTHTFMTEPDRVKNAEGKEVLIFQVGWAGINLGRVDFLVNKKTGKKTALGYPVKLSENSRG